MYKAPEIVIPNFFQIDTLPFLKQDSFPLNESLSSERIHIIRNFTHKHDSFIAKIFVFFPKYGKQNLSTFGTKDYNMAENFESNFELLLYSELPIITLETLKYIMNDLLNEGKMKKQEWNSLISSVENYTISVHKIIDQFFMSEHQLKFQNIKDSFPIFVYYSVTDHKFRLKTKMKSLNFQISSSFDKKKVKFEPDYAQNGFTITNKKIQEKLYEKMNERLSIFNKKTINQQTIEKFFLKYHRFYERHVKEADQNLLELQINTNIRNLRVKTYMPITLRDQNDDSVLIGPIFSNANINCMYGHFIGYNANTSIELQNTNCSRCGIKINQMSRNFILQYIRDSLFNPSQSDVLYCPQFNRFKLMKKSTEVERTAQKLQKLKIEEKKRETMMAENEESQMDEEQSDHPTFEPPHIQIKYHDYMHLRSVLIKTYSLTRNRIKIMPMKSTQTVKFTFNIYQKQNNLEEGYKNFYKSLELKDPARGKYCQHYQFADLRLFYRNRKTINNGFTFQQYFQCPICRLNIKDGDLIYLKQMTVLIKYLNHHMEDPNKKCDPMMMLEDEITKRKADRTSAQIIICNRERKIYIQYNYEQNGEMGRFLKEIEGLYKTMVDPYIHFSEYSLGLKRNIKKMNYFDEEEPQSEDEKLQKIWFKTSTRSKQF